MRTVHLLANAHIDPVWQWGFEEGIGAALATFRSAAMLLERNPGFVFCHNEALLYRWVEEYEPELFARISALVREGRWHIMGGFELQPDCVMTGGEAMVRQILQGRRYFREKFGVAPEIAVNFDSFGHSQGLVQILARSGYKAYIYMRPGEGPNDFVWRGLDGSSVLAHRIDKGYNSALGHAREALEGFLNARKGEELDLFPWGVGNHGGGPSQKDIDDLNAFAREKAGELRVIHSTPEAYFADVRRQKPDLPVVDKGLHSSNVGCYTSVMEVKRLHRQLEGAVISAERLASVAAMNGEMEYPAQQLADAWRTLSFLEFHDVLPGSHTRPVMERMMEYGGRGLDQARWVMDGVFFRMAASEPEAQPGVLPLLALNPHPYPVRAVVECEFMLPDQNWEEGAVTGVYVEQDGREVPSQVIKEDSTIALDWRKRVAVEAELKPLGITRLDCHLRSAQKKPAPRETLDFDNGEISLRISPETGLMDGLCLAGKPVAADGLGAIWAYADNADPWHMDGNAVGQFQFQLERKPGTRPHITEDGAIFTQVEAQLAGDGVEAVLQYRIPKKGRRIVLDVVLNNMAPDRMYRLRFPAPVDTARLKGETMFGMEEAFSDGTENVSQRFDVLSWEGGSLGVANDCVYGGRFEGGALLKSLLRSPVYCAHPISGRKLLPEDRMYDRSGIGSYRYRFVLVPSGADCTLETAREALLLNEPVLAAQHCPPGTRQGVRRIPFAVQGDVLVSAIKRAEDGNGYIVRVYEPAGQEAAFHLQWGEAQAGGALAPFEARAYRLADGSFVQCNLIEEAL